MPKLPNTHVAVLLMDGFEEAELTFPVKALRDAGAAVDIISENREPLQGFKHHTPTIKANADKTFDEVSPDQYDALLLPGGAFNADALRVVPAAQRFVEAFDAAEKPIAVICHAPWLLVSSDLVDGRTLTSFHTIADDIRNAGGRWVDQAVCEDGNLVSSRQPDDIPLFNEKMLELFARTGSAQRANA